MSRFFKRAYNKKGTFYWHTHVKVARGMYQEALDLERSNGGERTESKRRKDEDHDLWYEAWTSCRVQASFHVPSVALEWAATASSSMTASTGCTRNAVAQALEKGPWLQMYTWCQGTVHPLNGRPQREVQVGPDKPEVVASFCYLGDMLSEPAAVNFQPQRVKTAWKKFKELLPVLSSRHLSFKTRGHVYSSCVWSAKLHASETWPLTKPNLQRLQGNDKAMIRQICNVKPQDIVTTRSNKLFARPGIEDLDLILKKRMVQWYGHVEPSNGAVKIAIDVRGWWKTWPWKAQDDMEAADREGLQWVEALHYWPSWQIYLEIWCEVCHVCSKPAIWAHWCGCFPCTCMLIKSRASRHIPWALQQ